MTYIDANGTPYPQAPKSFQTSTGSFSGTGILPADAVLGDYVIDASDGTHFASTSFTIS
ncbi:MAG: hypothetical protein U0446_00350 [Dehalococcoidia bacterium]